MFIDNVNGCKIMTRKRGGGPYIDDVKYLGGRGSHICEEKEWGCLSLFRVSF